MTYPVYYPEAGDTLPIFFDSFAGSTGASITLTGLAVTDIEIYKDGGTTQRASDAGYTLLDTDGIDFDSITGIHGFSIDLSDNTDAGFYVVGPWYHVVVSSVTVDSQTVNFVAASFRIASVTRGLAGTALPDAVADAAGGLPISDAGGLDLDGSLSGHTPQTADHTAGIADIPTVAEFNARTIAAASYFDPATDTVANVTTVGTTTTNTDMRGTDSAALASVATEARLAELDAGNLPTDIASVQTDTTAIVADTNELQTDWANGGRLDLILDAAALEATVAALNDISTADVNAQVLDVMNTDTFAEPASVPAATASLVDKIGWLVALARNKLTQTATTATIRNDADGADIATSTVSDDGTTATRGEWT